MEYRMAFAASSAGALVLAACVFQACGGAEVINKDGGGDGSEPPDTGANPDGSNPDTGDMDTGVMDTGLVDSGPSCTNTPCVVGLAVGGHHACALIIDGTVRCWGVNARGQIGTFDGGPYNAANRLVPLQVDGLTSVTQVTASTVYTTFGATCARTSAGGVLCLGSNGSGQLGVAADNNPHAAPAQVMGLGMSLSTGLSNYYGCAVTNGGEYWCWGDNTAFGQSTGLLGRGAAPNGFGAAGKAALVDASVAQGAPGSFFNLALTSTGSVLSWGSNGQGELGRATTNGMPDVNPAAVVGITNAAQISAGEQHACAVTNTGSLLCWGSNSDGQLGQGIGGGSANMPATVAGGSLANKSVSQVSCSNSHVCALATDGSVHCWGRNNAGQVGPNGAMTGYNAADVLSPQLVTLSGKALAVGTGGTNTNQGATGYSCALLDGGSVQCWGINIEGELGRSADAGGTIACNGVGGASCSPNPAPVVWQ